MFWRLRRLRRLRRRLRRRLLRPWREHLPNVLRGARFPLKHAPVCAHYAGETLRLVKRHTQFGDAAGEACGRLPTKTPHASRETYLQAAPGSKMTAGGLPQLNGPLFALGNRHSKAHPVER